MPAEMGATEMAGDQYPDGGTASQEPVEDALCAELTQEEIKTAFR